MVNYYHNAKTDEIDSYNVEGNLTDFLRGVFLAYGDYLTTGFKTREEAEKWAQEWSACLKCKSAKKGKPGDICSFCGSVLSKPQKCI